MAASEGFFEARVLAKRGISPHMLRLALGGPGLEQFASTGVPDEWVRLYFPRAGETRLPLPTQVHGGGWDWGGTAPEGRYYTVRRWDPEARMLLLDVVVHSDGLATSWARDVAPGERIVLSAPRGSYAPPADATRQLLVGDLTALPAISRVVEEVPAGTDVRAVVEIPDERDRQEMQTQADLAVDWRLFRPSVDAPSTVEAIVRDLQWPEGDVYFWMAGEAGQMRGVRKYLRHERGMHGSSYDVMGYWRTGAEEWLRRFDAADIDIRAIWQEGVRLGRDDDEIMDDYEDALDRAGL
ncbi:MAG: siderophore-interacting protein [Nocardioidaceae bacterium]